MIARLRSLVRNVCHRARLDRDLDNELSATLDLLVREKIDAGMPPQAARRAAAIELGHIPSIREQVRERRTGAGLDTFVQDVRYAARLLARNPLFTLAATTSLAICIGANTAVFTLVNRLLFRDPPGVADPSRLVDIAPVADGRFREPFLHPMILTELQRRATLLAGVFGHQLDIQPLSLRRDGAAERVFGAYVTMNYFEVLGVRAASGRLFGSRDSETPGASPITVLSHRFWMRRFQGDPEIVGGTVIINGAPLTVVGVASAEFRGISLTVADLWLPSSMSSTLSARRGQALAAGGRLRPGVSIPQATAELAAIASAALPELPMPPVPLPGVRDVRSMSVRAAPASALPPVVRGLATGLLALLMGLASLVLLIACANVAGLLLARGVARRREIAVRLALGVGRARLVRHLITETSLLFLLGGAAGLALAQLMTGLLARTLPSLPAFVDTSLPLDYHVVLFTGAVSLGAAVAAGLLPAWQSSRSDVIAALKSDAQGPAERLRLRHGFVVAQVALSIALVAAAGLFAGAIHRSGTVESGFDASGVENTNLDLTLAGYTDSTGPAFVRELSERVRELPRVANATVAGLAPGAGRMELCCGIAVPGVEPPNGEEFFHPAWNVIEPGFFGTLRVPLRGRDFGPEDRRGTVPVAIVNESAARQYWGAADPLGKQILWQQTPGTRAGMRGSVAETKGPMLFGRDASARREPIALTVIGVAADVHPGGRERKDSIYLPFQQRYQSDVSVLARSNDGESVGRELRSLIASMDPNLPVISSEALGNRLGPVQLQLRLATGVSVGAGLVGVLLAGIGLYGVTAYAVTRRTREIGVRIAMGARPSDVTRLVLGHGMVLVLIGTVVGLALAGLAGRVLAHNRFGIPAVEPLTFAGAAAVLALVGLTACYVPVRRATRINPVDALRYE